MPESEVPDWLPPGWTVIVKLHTSHRTLKTFCHVETGKMFSSKKAVMEFIASQITPQPPSKQSKLTSKEITIFEQSSEITEWLPTGWITEVKIKGGSGKPYKVYIEPESGTKCYSKPEVSRYLDKLKSASTSAPKETSSTPLIKAHGVGLSREQTSSKIDASQNRRSGRSKNLVTKQDKNTVIEPSVIDATPIALAQITPDGLPIGWIRETNTKKSARGKKNFSSYTDPISGYVFSSKKDAWRFVETGSIESCVVKPKKRETDNPELTSGNVLKKKGQSENATPVSSTPQKSAIAKPNINKNGIDEHRNVDLGDTSTNNGATQKKWPNELPPGWIEEIKTGKFGSRTKRYVTYIDPLSGYIFNSKRDALCYLETGDVGSCSTKPTKRDTNDPGLIDGKISAIIHSLAGLESESDAPQDHDTTVITDSVDKAVNELPPDWITEVKTKKSASGTRKYQLYVEPSTGYEFKSKKDALRYLDYRDINKCAIKPKKRKIDANNHELMNAVVCTGEKDDETAITNLTIVFKPDARKDEITVSRPETNTKTKKDEITITSPHTNEKREDAPEWLPAGWSMASKTNDGANPRKYKFYVDSSTGRKFYSKPEVLRYLQTQNSSPAVAKENKEVEHAVKDNLTKGKSSMVPEKNVDSMPVEDEICSSEHKEVAVDECSKSSSVPDKNAISVPKEIKICSPEHKDGGVDECSKSSSVLVQNVKSVPIENKNCESEQKEVGVDECLTGSSVPDKNVDSVPIGRKICSSEHNELGVDKCWKSSSVRDNNGDYKPTEDKICSSEQKGFAVDKHPNDYVTVARSTIDELPLGWIKEIRSKTGANGTRKDPFYIDPLSGYEFRSLKDALRYLATGDIKSCAIRPKKPKTNELYLANSSVKANDSCPQCATRSEISAGKESPVPVIHLNHNLTKEKPDLLSVSSKRKLDTRKMGIATPSATKGRKKKRGKAAKHKRGSDSDSSSDYDSESSYEDENPRKKQSFQLSIPTRTSKRLVGLEPNTPINLAIFDGAPPLVHGPRLYIGDGSPQVHAVQNIQSIAHVHDNDQPQVIDPSPMAVDETGKEIVPKDSAEEMLSAELLNKIEKALQEHADIVEKIEKPVEQEQPPQPQEVPAVPDDVMEKPFEHQAVIYELIEKPLENNQPIIPIKSLPENSQKTIKNDLIENRPAEVAAAAPPPGFQSSQVFYPMMESWSDPCLEFAFKTLTGALPVQDNTITDDYFQRQVVPDPTVNNVGLSPFQDLPNYYQNPFSLNLNEPRRPVPRPGPAQQFPVNPSYMPGTSSGGSQQNPTWKQV